MSLVPPDPDLKPIESALGRLAPRGAGSIVTG